MRSREQRPRAAQFGAANPASTHGNWRKENVGVRSRHGLAYGKYQVKCKLTRLLNDSDMWVGITNAIWLLYDGAPDSLRRECGNGNTCGTTAAGGDERVPRVAYSEIDFKEILKTTAYCPSHAFHPPFTDLRRYGRSVGVGYEPGKPEPTTRA
ncbi:MAG: hypothetical protein R2818_07445 [Flavobacteriales bacterium]